jgi:hypothetical protein
MNFVVPKNKISLIPKLKNRQDTGGVVVSDMFSKVLRNEKSERECADQIQMNSDPVNPAMMKRARWGMAILILADKLKQSPPERTLSS